MCYNAITFSYTVLIVFNYLILILHSWIIQQTKIAEMSSDTEDKSVSLVFYASILSPYFIIFESMNTYRLKLFCCLTPVCAKHV